MDAPVAPAGIHATMHGEPLIALRGPGSPAPMSDLHYDYLWDAYHDDLAAAAAAHRRALEDLDDATRAELLRSSLLGLPAVDEGPWVLAEWLEDFAAARGPEFAPVAGTIVEAAGPVLEELGFLIDPPGLAADLAAVLHALGTRLALLEVRPYFELPPEAARLRDWDLEDRYGGYLAEAAAIEHHVVDELAQELEDAAGELLARAQRHHANVERLTELAAEARRSTGPAAARALLAELAIRRELTHTPAELAALRSAEAAAAAELRAGYLRWLFLETLAARERAREEAAEALADELLRSCRVHRARRAPRPAAPHLRRPRARTLCGHSVRPSAAPLAPNAPPARFPRVRCAARSAA